jgi:hypothetical protein
VCWKSDNPSPPDTTLTPPRAQYGATRSNTETRKQLVHAEFASSSKPLQLVTDHSYLASRRFETARRPSILLRFAGKTQGMESGLGQATEFRTATRYCNATSKAQIMPFCRGAGHGSKLCPSKQRLDRSTMVLIQYCFPGPLLVASAPILQQVLDVVQRKAVGQTHAGNLVGSANARQPL